MSGREIAVCLVPVAGLLVLFAWWEAGDGTKRAAAATVAVAPTAPVRRAAPTPSRAATPPIEVTAKDLAAAYGENELAADERYKGKRLRVTGSVYSIGSDIMGDPVISLAAGDETVACGFDGKGQMAALTKIRKRQVVTLIGEGAGSMLDSPVLNGCSIAP